MTSAWLLIQKSYHGELMGIPVVRWAAFLALTLVVFLTLRVLVTAVRSRLKARNDLTEPRLTITSCNFSIATGPQPPDGLRSWHSLLREAEGSRGRRGKRR